MINLFDILDRSYWGEKIEDEKQWDLRVWKKAVELAKKYNIRYDPKYAVVCDDDMADRCFEAAIQLLARVGVFNAGTKRVIRFEEEEIRKGLSQLRDHIIMGDGRDRVILSRRRIEAFDPVKFMAGHFACTDNVAPKLYQAMAEVQSLDVIEGFNFYGEHTGRQMEGMVHETLGTKAILSTIRPILYYPVSPNPAAMIAALDPDNGIRKTDAMEITPLPELKIESNLLAVAVAASEYGAFICSDDTSILHGFGGGPDENAIIGIAQSLQTYLTYRVDFKFLAQGIAVDATTGVWPESSWVRSMTVVTLSRNIGSPIFSAFGTAAEPGNDYRWFELALRTVSASVCGAHIAVCRPTRPMRPNLLTPLEIEWCSEISRAAVRSKISREEANRIIVERFAPRVKPVYVTPAKNRAALLKGKPFEELYDLNTLKPTNEYLESYRAARKEVASFGLKLEW
ncbi:MAG: monomethylamine:corrinoid methyltransferase [Thermodesulfobacteriota bacterium]